MKTLVDGWLVWMKVSPTIPALEVHAVLWAAEGIEISITPSFSSCSVSFLDFESGRGVGILAAPMALACSNTRAGLRRALLGDAMRSGSAASTLGADCSALHCRPGCSTLHSLKWHLDLVCCGAQGASHVAVTVGVVKRACLGWASCFERPRGQQDLAASCAPLAWCMTAGEGGDLGIGGRHIVDCVDNLV